MTCSFGYTKAYTRSQDLIVTGEAENGVSWLTITPALSSPTLASVSTFCPGFTVGADDTIDVYKASDLTPVATQVDVRTVSTTATTAVNTPVGGALHTSGRTVAVDSTYLASASKTFAGLVNASPLVPNEYRGEVVATWATTTPTPSWTFADTSATLAHQEFFGLPSVPKNVYAAGVARATAFTSQSFHIGDNTSNLSDNITSARRVTGLTVTAFAHRLVNPVRRASEFDSPYRLRLGVVVSGKLYLGPSVLMPNTPQDVSYTWRRNPATNRAWTATQLAAFRSGQGSAVVVWMTRPNDPDVIANTAGAVYRVTASVSHVPETRVGVLRRALTTQTLGWNTWNAEQPDGTATISLDADTEYLFVQSRITQEESDRRASLRPRNLGIRAVGANRGVGDFYPVVVKPSFVDGIPRNVGDRTDLVPAMLALTSTGFADGADSSPVSTVIGETARGIVTLDPGFPTVVSNRTFINPSIAYPKDPDRVVFTVRSQFDNLPFGPLSVSVVSAPTGLPGYTIATAPDVMPDDLVSPQSWLTVESELTPTAGGWTDVPVVERVNAGTAGSGETAAASVTQSTIATNQSPARVVTFDAGGTGAREGAVTLSSGENDGTASYRDVSDVYVGTNTTPARIVKVDVSNPAAPTRTSAITLSSDEDQARAIVESGASLYVLCANRGRLVRVTKSTFTRDSVLVVGGVGESGWSAVVDPSGDFVWVGLGTSPAKVALVDISGAMTLDSTVTLASGENVAKAIAVDNDFVWVATDTTPARLVKIDRVGGARVSAVTLDAGFTNPVAVSSRKDGVYVACGTNPGRIAVVDRERMAQVGSVTLETGEAVTCGAGLPDLFLGTSQSPAKFIFYSVGEFLVVDPPTPYYLSFEATSIDTGWQVLTQRTGEDDPGVLSSPALPAPFSMFSVATVTLGATYWENTNGVVGTTLSSSIALSPSAPTGFDAEVIEPVDGSPCRPMVRLEWDDHVFDTCDIVTHWELQRRDPRTDWQTIMLVDVYVTEVWDVEAARNTTSEYRLRAIDRDPVGGYQVSSNWSDPVEVTTTDDCCGYVIASNHLGAGDYLSMYPTPEDRTLWYDDTSQRAYNLLEDFAFVEFESGDGAEIVRPLTDRLDFFSTTLLIAGKGAVDSSLRLGANVGRRLFDPLAEFSGNKRNSSGRLVRIPYVAVLDSNGNRWFAQIATPTGVRSEPAGSHSLSVEVREVSKEPIPVQVFDPMNVSGS